MAGNTPANKSNESRDRQLEGVKMPPHSVEAEQSVLGGLMLDNERWDNVSERVVAGDFYSRPHRLIFSEMQRLLELGQPIDLITLSESLETRGELELVGGSPIWRSWLRIPRVRRISVPMRISCASVPSSVK